MLLPARAVPTATGAIAAGKVLGRAPAIHLFILYSLTNFAREVRSTLPTPICGSLSRSITLFGFA